MKNSSINKPPKKAKSDDFKKEWSYKSECTFSHFKKWCREAEYLVLSNYGDLDAFKGEEILEPISIEKLFENDFEPPRVGSAYKEYCRLESQYYLFDLDHPDYQRNHWNLIGLLWGALQTHQDPYFHEWNYRMKCNIQEAKASGEDYSIYERMIHINNVAEIEPIEEFEARLLLIKMKAGVVYRVIEGKDKPTKEDYLTPLKHVHWLKTKHVPLNPPSITTKTEDSLTILEKGWNEIKLLPRPSQRRLGLKQLQKELKMNPKELSSLIYELQVEKSSKNQKLNNFNAVMSGEFNQKTLVDNFIMSGTVSMIAGDGGSGKTSLLYQTAESVTTGKPLFGRLTTKKRKCLLIQCDESHVNAQTKWKRMNLQPDPAQWELCWKWTASQLPDLRQWIDNNGFGLVQMDSFGVLFGGNEAMNDAEIGLYMYELNSIAADNEAAIVVNHHLKKRTHKNAKEAAKWKPSLGDFFGSSYIVNGIRDAWGLWKKGEHLDGSPIYGLKYLKDNSGLIENGFVMNLLGSEESYRYSLFGDEGGVKELDVRNTIRSQLHSGLKSKAGEWLPFTTLKTFTPKADDRSIKRELANLFTHAAATGIERRPIESGHVGRPKYEYRFAICGVCV